MKTFSRSTVAVLMALASFGAGAQTSGMNTSASPGPRGVIVGAEGELAIPIGNYSDATGLGIGASITGEYPVNPMISLTGRIGFQFHLSKSVTTPFGSADSHVHALPILVGGHYYFQAQPGTTMTSSSARQGIFGAAELGFFWLFSGASSGGVSASSSDLKFGIGAGAGYQMGALSFRAMIHSHSIGSFGDTLMLTGVVGYEFAGL